MKARSVASPLLRTAQNVMSEKRLAGNVTEIHGHMGDFKEW
jgi:hypothetical protein